MRYTTKQFGDMTVLARKGVNWSKFVEPLGEALQAAKEILAFGVFVAAGLMVIKFFAPLLQSLFHL